MRASSTATLDDIVRKLNDLEKKVIENHASLESKITHGLADVRSLIGGVHETSLRAELRIQRGHAFAENYLVSNALSIVRLVAPAGQLLPSEHSLLFADLNTRVADVTYLEVDRATRLASECYVSLVRIPQDIEVRPHDPALPATAPATCARSCHPPARCTYCRQGGRRQGRQWTPGLVLPGHA